MTGEPMHTWKEWCQAYYFSLNVYPKYQLQGLKLCFGNDLTNPVMWSAVLNSTVHKFSKSVQTLARNDQKMPADV